MQLTDKQKELFQLDKYVLVDTIIILEDKTAKLELAHRADLQTVSELMDELKGSKNEMLLNEAGWRAASLNTEELKAELETERSMREKLEKAHITAQEQIDVLNDISNLDNDAFLHALQGKIDKYMSSSLASREKVIEEGENGSI